MRKTLATLSLALMLAGCQDLTAYLAKVQAITGPLCKFVPVAADVTGLAGQYPTAEQAADAICQVVNGLRLAARRGATPDGNVTISVRGVRVTGRFVR